MLEKTLLLETIDHVRTFSAIASGKDYDITLTGVGGTANAKIISEIFKLDLTKPVVMRAECNMIAELSRQIEPFICKKG